MSRWEILPNGRLIRCRNQNVATAGAVAEWIDGKGRIFDLDRPSARVFGSAANSTWRPWSRKEWARFVREGLAKLSMEDQ